MPLCARTFVPLRHAMDHAVAAHGVQRRRRVYLVSSRLVGCRRRWPARRRLHRRSRCTRLSRIRNTWCRLPHTAAARWSSTVATPWWVHQSSMAHRGMTLGFLPSSSSISIRSNIPPRHQSSPSALRNAHPHQGRMSLRLIGQTGVQAQQHVAQQQVVQQQHAQQLPAGHRAQRSVPTGLACTHFHCPRAHARMHWCSLDPTHRHHTGTRT